MTLSEMLVRMDSRELSERMILDQKEWWQKRLAETPEGRSQALMYGILGKASGKANRSKGSR